MSAAAWIVTGVLAAAVFALVIAAVALRARLARTESRLASLERSVHGELERSVASARADAAEAAALARRAAGIAEPDAPLVLEPVTGRLIKAVALGAGARRAIGRLARRAPERQAS